MDSIASTPTWQDFVVPFDPVPGLVNQIIADAARYPGHRWKKYEWGKVRLAKVVGWHSRHPGYQNSDAYDHAIRLLVDAIERRRR